MAEPVEQILRVSSEDVPVLIYGGQDDSSRPAVVLSTEAYGINEFTRHVASKLAALGYAVVVPDYYHGRGLSDPEGYADFTEVMGFIERLDFAQGAHEIMAAAQLARELPGVDPARVAVWGYCTGGTLAMMAACLDRELAAAVLFFPSQPTFPELDKKRPLNPIDLLWNANCPIQLLIGDQDHMLVEMLPEFRSRFAAWGIDHEVRVYPGAGHAFSAPAPPLRYEEADRASWADAIEFLKAHCPL